METIYRTYADCEVAAYEMTIECPHCGEEWTVDDDYTVCGETYEMECEGCEKKFEMHFDAS